MLTGHDELCDGRTPFSQLIREPRKSNNWSNAHEEEHEDKLVSSIHLDAEKFRAVVLRPDIPCGLFSGSLAVPLRQIAKSARSYKYSGRSH